MKTISGNVRRHCAWIVAHAISKIAGGSALFLVSLAVLAAFWTVFGALLYSFTALAAR